MRTPRESACFSGKKQQLLFFEDERLVGQIISAPQLRVTDAFRSAKKHLRFKMNRCGDHVTSTAAVMDAESWGEYVTVAHLGD